jgi:hypothetical protein
VYLRLSISPANYIVEFGNTINFCNYLQLVISIIGEGKMKMNQETQIALLNYDWLMRNREDVEIDFEVESVVFGNGGIHTDVLCEPGLTPATAHLEGSA